MSNNSVSLEVYTKGTRVWLEDQEIGWISATVDTKRTDDTKIYFSLVDDEGATREYETKIDAPILPPLRNPPVLEGIDDLTNLSYLHEPAVLHNISVRYAQRNIYTYSGIVLIATNPFQKVNLYSHEAIKAYSGKDRGDMEPHLFAIAEDAYRCMIKDSVNQTVIVSGESGAGKTVSAKFIMRYFASVNLDLSSSGADSGMSETEKQILATNPILESFGNAKTTRNDNSSRFGKYIEIQFDNDINIKGAKIRTYLLERSRLVFQPNTERNYHIFYQLCAGIPDNKRAEFHLGKIEEYHYLNQGGIYTIDGVNDKEEFNITSEALGVVGIDKDTMWGIYKICAALLHMGNITIGGNDKSGANISDSDEALAITCELLQINKSEFRKWMMKKQIITRNDKIISNLNTAQATVVRDSSAKFLYSNLFDWLIKRTNDKLGYGDESQIRSFIGVLDIYGFEHFQKNSFEQFCINYANEKLQQQFNQHVFKLEQEEYIKEKINWTFIEFSDNKPCIEIIENKLGILSLLDEQSRLPSGSDEGFINKLYETLATPTNEKYFSKPRFGNTAFTISHYAHDVTYESENFLEKNRDTVPDEIMTVFQNSQDLLVKDIIPAISSPSESPKPIGKPLGPRQATSKKQTLGSVFKLSLNSLMDTIGKTNVHYIRCIKPNEAKQPWVFDNKMVLSQLRACGVLETIRISCSGYPSRRLIEEFVQRYYIILPFRKWDDNVSKTCQTILSDVLVDPDKYQIGATKVFFRAGQLAYLEKMRNDKINSCAIFIQKNVRRMLCRTHYLRLRFSSIVSRARNINKFSSNLITLYQKSKAAISIQSLARRSIARQSYVSTKKSIVSIQAYSRGLIARKKFLELKKNVMAIKIQSISKRFLVRKNYLRQLQLIILIQSCYRRAMAKKELRTLKLEARSVKHLKDTSAKLENKIISMSQQLNAKDADLKEMIIKTSALEEEINSWRLKYEKMMMSNQELLNKSELLLKKEEELEAIKEENSVLLKRHEEALKAIEEKNMKIQELTTSLEENKASINTLHSTSSNGGESEEINKLKAEIAELKEVLEETRRARQLRELSVNPSVISKNSGSTAVDNINDYHSTNNHRRSETIGYTSASTKFDGLISPTLARKRINRTSIRSVDIRNHRNSWNPLSFFSPTQEHIEIAEESGETLQNILEGDSLVEEVISGLIDKLNIPLPNFENPRSSQEILFPAHMIGMCIIQMYKYDLANQISGLISDVLFSIKAITEKADGDFIFAFWFSNISELLTILLTASGDMEVSSDYESQINGDHLDPQQVISDAVKGLNVLLSEIMASWLKELQKRIGKIVIPAVVENQSLPGFVSNDTGFFNKIIGQTQSTITIDHAINFLSILTNTLNYYYVDKIVIEHMLEHLLNFVGVLSFNHIIMRKNFCSWKRGMQIQYNVTRVEEWCSSKGIEQEATNLEQLMQAAKLLQLQKNTLQDLDILYDACHLLNPGQIKKLISIYYLSEFENPIPLEISKEVARRAALSEKTDVLFLETLPLRIPVDYRSHFSGKNVEVEKFCPPQINLPRLKYVLQSSN